MTKRIFALAFTEKIGYGVIWILFFMPIGDIKNEHRQIINCNGCGRDTREYSGFCLDCYKEGYERPQFWDLNKKQKRLEMAENNQ